MKKKAQGLPINVIIIAAIVLIVLVVLVAVFTGRMGWFGKELDIKAKGLTCGEQGGTPVARACTASEIELFGTKDIGAGKSCCKPG